MIYDSQRLSRARSLRAAEARSQLPPHAHPPGPSLGCSYYSSPVYCVVSVKTGPRLKSGQLQRERPGPQLVHAGRAGYRPAATTVLRRGTHQAAADRSGLHSTYIRLHCSKMPQLLSASSHLPASGWCNLRCCSTQVWRRLFYFFVPWQSWVICTSVRFADRVIHSEGSYVALGSATCVGMNCSIQRALPENAFLWHARTYLGKHAIDNMLVPWPSITFQA